MAEKLRLLRTPSVKGELVPDHCAQKPFVQLSLRAYCSTAREHLRAEPDRAAVVFQPSGPNSALSAGL